MFGSGITTVTNKAEADQLISEINNIDNLIALCPNHHWEFDHSQLNISEYII